MKFECDGIIHNPLGGGSYVFEKDIVGFLLKKFTKNKIVISIGAQPNSSPHFGTLIVFSLAFSCAKKMKEINPNIDVSILFEVVDTARSETIEIDGIKYQRSLRNTNKISECFDDYVEILEYFKEQDNINYIIRHQRDFNNQEYIYKIVKKLIENKEKIGPILDPKYNNLRIRIECPKCGLSDKNGKLMSFKGNIISSYCKEHGYFSVNIKENTENLEYNTPLRNLIRGMVYGMINKDSSKEYQIMRITGSDYAGFYQEELLYKPAAILGFPIEDLPVILYAPLVLDWSGAKLSKSLYVKDNAYKDLPSYLINYKF